jgi:hypothetical protein
MKITLLPQTHPGKWSVSLMVAFLICLSLLSLFAILGQTFHENPWLTIPVFAAYGASIPSFITGLVGIATKRERAFLVYLAVGVGLLFIIFEAGDILFHY